MLESLFSFLFKSKMLSQSRDFPPPSNALLPTTPPSIHTHTHKHTHTKWCCSLLCSFSRLRGGGTHTFLHLNRLLWIHCEQKKKKKKDRDREGILMTFVHFHIILKSLTSAVKQRASNNWTISFKFIELFFLFFFHLLHPARLQHATHSLCMLSTHHPLFKASSIFGVILCPSAIRVWLYGASGRCWCEGIDVSGAVKSPESRHWN